MTGVAISQGFQLAMTVYAKRPNVSRQELTIEIPGQPVMTIVNLFDGKGWMINPMMEIPRRRPCLTPKPPRPKPSPTSMAPW